MNKLVHRSKLFVGKNASTILTCMGGMGVITTTILAVKATPKALKLLEKAKEEKRGDLTKTEIVKTAGPSYIPAIASGAATIACIFGANILNKRQQAAIMSAYALLDNSYKEYKKKTIELYGEEANDNVIAEIAKDKYEETDLENEDDGKVLFFDYFSERYFRSTIEDVQRAEYRINRNLVMRDYAYLNEFYEELGIDPIDSGYKYGWSSGTNYERYWQQWIDFTHKKFVTDDGLEGYIIQMQHEPILGFEDYA